MPSSVHGTLLAMGTLPSVTFMFEAFKSSEYTTIQTKDITGGWEMSGFIHWIPKCLGLGGVGFGLQKRGEE